MRNHENICTWKTMTKQWKSHLISVWQPFSTPIESHWLHWLADALAGILFLEHQPVAWVTIQISRCLILEILFFCKICLGTMLVRYRRINNKVVLDRPWTIWKVLRAISSTLKCQFIGNHEMKRLDYLVRHNIGDTGPIKSRKVFPLISVLSKPPQLPYGANPSFYVPQVH